MFEHIINARGNRFTEEGWLTHLPIYRSHKASLLTQPHLQDARKYFSKMVHIVKMIFDCGFVHRDLKVCMVWCFKLVSRAGIPW